MKCLEALIIADKDVKTYPETYLHSCTKLEEIVAKPLICKDNSYN